MTGSAQAFLDGYEVDHKSGQAYNGHISNLQAMCHECNYAKGRLEIGGGELKELCKWCPTTKRVLRRDGGPLFKQVPQP